MAATGNEAVKLEQLKDIYSILASTIDNNTQNLNTYITSVAQSLDDYVPKSEYVVSPGDSIDLAGYYVGYIDSNYYLRFNIPMLNDLQGTTVESSSITYRCMQDGGYIYGHSTSYVSVYTLDNLSITAINNQAIMVEINMSGVVRESTPTFYDPCIIEIAYGGFTFSERNE